MAAPLLLLCSASPRRRELLAQLGLRFVAVAPEVDESPRAGETAPALGERLAKEKALAGVTAYRAGGGDEPLIALAADTVVVSGAEILGKPRDRADAARMLRLLAGTDHSVLTSVCAMGPHGGRRCMTVETRVRFRPLSPAQLAWLVDSGDGDDKAGAYAVQGLAGAFVERLDGSYSNVVGLPLVESLELLAWAGLPLPWDAL